MKAPQQTFNWTSWFDSGKGWFLFSWSFNIILESKSNNKSNKIFALCLFLSAVGLQRSSSVYFLLSATILWTEECSTPLAPTDVWLIKQLYVLLIFFLHGLYNFTFLICFSFPDCLPPVYPVLLFAQMPPTSGWFGFAPRPNTAAARGRTRGRRRYSKKEEGVENMKKEKRWRREGGGDT